jgi:hypothetical protein
MADIVVSKSTKDNTIHHTITLRDGMTWQSIQEFKSSLLELFSMVEEQFPAPPATQKGN